MSFKISGAPIIKWRNRSNTQNFTINVYRSTSTMDTNDLPSPYASLSGDKNMFTDTSVVYGETYYYIIETTYGNNSNLSTELVYEVGRELIEPFDISAKYYETDSGDLTIPVIDGIYDKFLGN